MTLLCQLTSGVAVKERQAGREGDDLTQHLEDGPGKCNIGACKEQNQHKQDYQDILLTEIQSLRLYHSPSPGIFGVRMIGLRSEAGKGFL